MKPGRRALGIAESYRGVNGAISTLAGAVVRADRAVDDFGTSTCTVGGLDATAAITTIWDRLDRPDVRYLFVAGVAPAWFNILDLSELAEQTARPVIAVSFEESDGLEAGIKGAFSGDERTTRLVRYHSLPDRRRLHTDGRDYFIRSVGIDENEAATVVKAYTYDRRPEPLRVAQRLARRLDAARRDDILRGE